MTTERNDNGAKARQRADQEDRTVKYRDWHRSDLSGGCYVMDIDQIEYRFINGVPVPVAVIELTMVQPGRDVDENYLAQIINRFGRQAQGEAITTFATMLGVEAFISLFDEPLDQFWVYNLNRPKRWHPASRDIYQNWIEGL